MFAFYFTLESMRMSSFSPSNPLKKYSHKIQANGESRLGTPAEALCSNIWSSLSIYDRGKVTIENAKSIQQAFCEMHFFWIFLREKS
jgi:hypothetical protein